MAGCTKMEVDLHEMKIEVKEEAQAVFPEKVPPSKFKGSERLQVAVNLFDMNVDGMPERINKYRIEIMRVGDKGPRDATRGPKADGAVLQRKRVLLSLFNDFMKKFMPAVDKYAVLYDLGNLVYSMEKLPIGVEDLELPLEEISSDNSKAFLGAKTVKVTFKVSYVGVVIPRVTGDLKSVRETQAFLEVLTSALMYKSGDHLYYLNRYYEKSSRGDEKIDAGAKVVKQGMEKNVRIVGGDDGKQAKVMLQIDAKKSPFFAAEKLIFFIADLLGCRGEDEVSYKLRDRRSIAEVNKQLKDLWVMPTYSKRGRAFSIHGICSNNAKQQKIQLRDGEEVSVQEYMEDKYKLRLQFPDCPLVMEKKPNGASYYPMELLQLERGQRITNAKMTNDMAEVMIKKCQMLPVDLREHIVHQLEKAQLDDRNKFLSAFKVKISPHMVSAEARRLFPPAIGYANKKVQSSRGEMFWKADQNDKFVKPATIRKWTFVIFDRCTSEDQVGRFCGEMCRFASSRGMQFTPRDMKIMECSSEDTEDIVRMFEKARNSGINFIVALSKGRTDGHDALKSTEAKYGIVTMHLQLKTFNKGGPMVWNNLLMKINLKTGGVNHTLVSSDEFRSANGFDMKSLFPTTRMFIGLDISHAGPQSFTDRNLGIKQSEPSVVGMAYSVNEVTEVRGEFWMQEPLLAKIDNLATHVEKAIKEFKEVSGKPPHEIVVLRGGVSEGEFPKVIDEMEVIESAFARLSPNYKPGLTCFVIQTNSNFRVLPTDPRRGAKAFEQNVKCGTVVDRGVTNPNYNQFLMVAQKAIQGTSKPVMCTNVFMRRMKMNMDEMQHMIHSLCYAHQVVAGSTSIPSLLYAATNLSKRGRNNWKTVNYVNDDLASLRSGASGGNAHYTNDGSDDFFARMSDDLKTSLKTAFWA